MNILHLRRPRRITLLRAIPLIALSALLAGAVFAARRNSLPPLHTVSHVDIPRYMGHWRVIAEIPYFAEKGDVDSIESYALLPDGTIHNWFTFRKKSFDAPQRTINAHAYIVNKQTNAEWKVKFFGGLISVPYLVLDIDPDYQWIVVGHPSRNLGWIMAREKTLPDSTYKAILNRLAAQHYDITRFEKVPQLPPR